MSSVVRIFLTCELHPKLPLPLLRASEVIVFEASTGIKANIQRFYNSLNPARIDRQPAERVRMYGLLAWFNAVVQERLRFARTEHITKLLYFLSKNYC